MPDYLVLNCRRLMYLFIHVATSDGATLVPPLPRRLKCRVWVTGE